MLSGHIIGSLIAGGGGAIFLMVAIMTERSSIDDGPMMMLRVMLGGIGAAMMVGAIAWPVVVVYVLEGQR